MDGGRCVEKQSGLEDGCMDDKKLIGKLDEISQRMARTDKQIEFSNIATKVHGLLTNKCGKLTAGEAEVVRELGAQVTRLAEGGIRSPKGLKTKVAGAARGGAARGAGI